MSKKIHGAEHEDGTPDHEHSDLQAQADTSTADVAQVTGTVDMLADVGQNAAEEAQETRDMVDGIDAAQKDQQEQISALKKRLDDQESAT